MKPSTQWSVRDVITTVLLSMLILIIHLAVNMICMINDFMSMVLSTGISCLLAGPVYFLLISRVRKRFVTVACMSLMGFFYFITGFWFLLPYLVIAGLVCELALLQKRAYESPVRITVSWLLCSLSYTGVNLIPIWLFWNEFEQAALKGGMRQAYIDAYRAYYTRWDWLIAIMVITLSCGLMGSLMGRRIVSGHFKKAGLV